MFLGVSSRRGYCCHKESHNDYNQTPPGNTYAFCKKEIGKADSTTLRLATRITSQTDSYRPRLR